ncbi:MAG: zinc metallopeptidase [Candidatus Margulisbacteria bacterium]|nr:zinc metallopeptidase [Candidatus Margulisiibacteriota bacterium]MBU1617637.1 zinc metallopeptidase [Candidatus Margulisiibacteriota bacterium]
MYYYDWTLILLLPAMILAFYAQFKVKSTFAKYSNVSSRKGITGASAAQSILNSAGLAEVAVKETPGELSDHYDPRDKTLYLSQEVYRSTSVASLGVAAHEAGHAVQDARSYAPLKMRNGMVPISNLGTTLAFPLFFLGILFSYKPLMDIGIVFFSLAVFFSVVTLPVEFDASRRAIKVLAEGGYLTEAEVPMARSVLNAAALTYIAAAAMAILNLVRLLALRNQRD